MPAPTGSGDLRDAQVVRLGGRLKSQMRHRKDRHPTKIMRKASAPPDKTAASKGSFLADKLLSSLLKSLFEVFARLDDDGGVSVLNLDVVDLPDSLPDTTINDFLYFMWRCFHRIPEHGEKK